MTRGVGERGKDGDNEEKICAKSYYLFERVGLV